MPARRDVGAGFCSQREAWRLFRTGAAVKRALRRRRLPVLRRRLYNRASSLAGPGSLLSPLKQTVRKLVGTPLGWRLARAAVRSPGALVLMYHRVGPADAAFKSVSVADFRRQMTWLARNCRPIAAEALEASAH